VLAFVRGAEAFGGLHQPKGGHVMCCCFGLTNLSQRVRAAPMPKPDKVLRFRPLKEVERAVSQLKRVLLLHPKPIVEELPAQYCVCKKGAQKRQRVNRDDSV
jgi:hypothetical protein